MARHMVIDLDDTLIKCHHEFLDVIKEGASYINNVTGLSVELAEQLIGQVDLISAKHHLCFNKDRFPNSFGTALKTAADITKTVLTMDAYADIVQVGCSVFTKNYPIFPNVLDALSRLRVKGYSLSLYTKGDKEIQNYKVDKHRLRDCFDRVEIVPKKTTRQLQEFIGSAGFFPADTIVVGDSLRDDIAPAKEAGCSYTIHVKAPDAWEFSNYNVTPDYVISSFPEVLKLA